MHTCVCIYIYISSNVISYFTYLASRAPVVSIAARLHDIPLQGPAAKAVRQLRENSEAQLTEANSIQVLSTLLGNLAPQQHWCFRAQGCWGHKYAKVLDVSKIIGDIGLSCWVQDADFAASISVYTCLLRQRESVHQTGQTSVSVE